MITAEQYAETIITSLKKREFYKSKLSWYKKQDGVTILLNIQKSQYGADVWYYNFGIGINALHKRITSINNCDMVYRIEQRIQGKWVDQEALIRILDRWLDKYGTIEKMHKHALAGTLPASIDRVALVYLTTVVF